MAHVVNFSPLPTEAVAAQLEQVELPVHSVRDREDDVEACRGAVVAIADYSGERAITGAHVEALAGTCKLVAVPSAGLDAVDLDACRSHGVPVASAKGLNAGPVAEWAVWATIGAMRGLSDRDTGIRNGEWQQFGVRYELSGKTVGVVGLGEIGDGVATRLGSFGVTTLYWTRTRRPADTESDLGVQWRELDDLLAESDVVVLAIALSDETRNLLDERRLGLLRPTAVVVNAGRAGLVDQDALLAALDEGRLHGYATDVFQQEPPAEGDPMPARATIATPHVAGVTVESVGRIIAHTFANVNRVLNDQTPVGLVD